MKIALLTAGPSLRDIYTDELGKNFDLIYAVNHAGLYFVHDYWIHLDTAHRILGKRAKFPDLCRRGPLTRDKLNRAGCSQSFPSGLYHISREFPDAFIFIFGWDADGVGLSGHDSPKNRWRAEIEQIAKSWDKHRMFAFGKVPKETIEEVERRAAGR